MERIQKIIANSGYCSRRKAEELIEGKNVKINGEIAKLGDKANGQDKITINGEEIRSKSKKFYYILNKPKGILVTKSDPQNRKTIYGLNSLKKLRDKIGINLNYVGRLDAMSEGLLILTSDGELNNALTHPKHDIAKTYSIRAEPEIKNRDIVTLKNGLDMGGRKLFAKISNIKKNTFEISIKEGRNRIIRRALEKLNYRVYKLERISTGTIKLGSLKAGEIRELKEREIIELKQKAGIS